MDNPITRRTGNPVIDLARQRLSSGALAVRTTEAAEGDLETALRMACDALVKIRQQDVATLGDHEAFVRHSPDGDLLQVLRPVKLSLQDGTLHRIEDKVMISSTGLKKMDAVVGSSKGTQIETEEGPPLRYHVRVRLVAASPVTGNPHVTDYEHTEEPERYFAEHLARYAAEAPQSCYVCGRGEAPEGWGWLEMYGGEGFAYDRRHPLYAGEMRKGQRGPYHYKGVVHKRNEILRFAKRKAATVAIRNAQRQHPAFGGQVQFDEADLVHGAITIPVIGWAGAPEAVGAMRRIHQRLAHGLDLPDEVEIIEAQTEPDEEPEPVAPEDPEEAAGLADVEVDEDEQQRRELVEIVREGVRFLSGDDAEDLAWDEDGDLDHQEEIRRKVDALLAETSDEGGES